MIRNRVRQAGGERAVRPLSVSVGSADSGTVTISATADTTCYVVIDGCGSGLSGSYQVTVSGLRAARAGAVSGARSLSAASPRA